MKLKHIFISVLAVFVLAAFTAPVMATGQWSPLFTKKQPGGMYGVINTDMTTGDVWYVDSGAGTDGSGYGRSPISPFATIDYAVGQCTANAGDTIYVMPGHAENLSSADAVDVDVAGVRIIGLGDGADRPTLTYTATAGEFVIGAASVTVENIIFKAGISNITMGISVEAAGDDFTLRNCEFAEPSTATYDFAIMVDLASGANNVCVEDCEFNQLSVTAGDLDYGIKVGAGVCNNLTVKDCVIGGPFTVAAIWSDQIDKEVNISDNVISNVTTGQMCIELTANATGNIVGNVCYGDTEAAIIDGGTCYAADNTLITTTDTPGLPKWVVTNGLNHLVALDGTGAYPEQAANDSIIAKICAKGATATCSTYDNTTDSLEAIADRGVTILADTAAMQPCAPGCVSKTLTTIANGNNDLFVVSGTCKIVEIVGIVTTQIEAKSCLINYNMDPTSPAGDTAFGTDGTALEINADAVGTLYTWDGVVANDLTATTNGVAIGMANDTGLVVPAGSLELAAVVATSATGAITFSVRYVPLESGATITAAP